MTLPYSSTTAAVRSLSRGEAALVQLAQNLRAFFPRRPAVSRVLGRGDRPPRIFLVSKCDARDDLTVSGPDNVHHLGRGIQRTPFQCSAS